VNALISQKVHASQAQIIISTWGLFPERFWIEDMDICVLFSNLISNSVEACERLTYKKKEISLLIDEDEDGVSFTMKNPTECEMGENASAWKTTKEDKVNHGYGLRNIKHIVKKYHGDMKIACEDGLVLVKIRFPRIAIDKAL